MHAVSVGEVNLLAPVIEQLIGDAPDLEIVISTSTETGYSLAEKKYADHQVFFCPYDFSWAIGNVIRRIRPTAIVLAELELWPNMVRIAQAKQIPVVVINGRLSEKSYLGYQKYPWFTRPIFQGLSRVLAQTDEYAQRFRDLGCSDEQVVVSGNVKFDGVQTQADNARMTKLAQLAGFQSQDFVMVAGSTQLEEDLILATVFQQLQPEYPELKLVLVPRHPQRSVVLHRQLAQAGIDAVFRTDLDAAANSVKPISVLIVDVIGELGDWWGRADVAYVGGSMGKREGQNMIEPAAYGVPTSFGPRTKNFRDVVSQLTAAAAVQVVHDTDQLSAFVSECLTSPEQAKAMGNRAKAVVTANRGAAKFTADQIRKIC